MIHGIDLYSYDIEPNRGYGVAYKYIKEALEANDINVTDKAHSILNFCKPEHYKFKDLTIGYTPWESTEVLKSWIEPMKRVDDLWTTSKWIAKIFSKIVDRDVFVLPHGIDPSWTPMRHVRGTQRFRFIHTGSPASRKGQDILLEVWWKHFKYNKDIELVFKCSNYVPARILDQEGSIIATPADIKNIIINGSQLCQSGLWKEYALAHCMVYPSRGEGFGLIPFESMAMGLPTILPSEGMGDFTDLGIELKQSKWVQSPYQIEHPGKWQEHSIDEIIYLMEHVIENYDEYAQKAYAHAKFIHLDFDWKDVGALAVDRLHKLI